MTNDYFNDTSPLARHTTARAEAVNAKMAAIEAGFDRLPDELVLNEGRVAFAVDSGAANAYVATMPQTWTAYTNGATINLQIGAGNGNTGAATLNVDSLGVRNIKRMDGTDVVSGDLAAGRTYTLIYDSANTRFNLLSYVSTDQTSINTVATNIANVSTVAGISGNVTTVAGISGNVTTVAGVSANVTTVAGISGAVSTVAGISAAVSTVAGDGVDIDTVAGISADIQTLADIEDGTTATGAISDVAAIASDVTTVAADGTDIGTVAGISSDVSTVAGVSTDIATLADIEDGTNATGAIQAVAAVDTDVTAVAAVAANVTTVAGISGNVTTVADISANVTDVAGISANVTTVAGIDTDVTAVAGIAANVTTVATDIADVSTVATNIADVTNVSDNMASILAALGDSVTTSGTIANNDYAKFNSDGDLVGRSYSEVRSDLGLVIGSNVQGYDADTLKADTHDTLTAGFDSDAEALGTITSGTVTPEVDGAGEENFKTLTANGAFTLAPPSTSGNCVIILQVTNDASAGTITTSGFTTVNGDTYETTNGNDYLFHIKKVGSFTSLTIEALQ